MAAAQGRETKAQQVEPSKLEEGQSTELMQRIETLLNTLPLPTTPVPTPAPVAPRLTEEVRAKLRQPIPPEKQLSVFKGKARGTYHYADEDYLKSRLTEVDPDWTLDYHTVGNIVTCTIGIFGVPRSALAGVEPPPALRDTNGYVVRDANGSAIPTAPGDPGYMEEHTRVSKGQSAAFRRACAEHELGAHMWPSKLATQETEGATEDAHSTGKAQFRTSGGNSRSGGSGQPREFREPSEARIKLLVDMGVPEAVAKLINSESHRDAAGKFMKDAKGNPVSDVSETITALFAARGRDKGALARKVWEPIVAENAPYAFASVGSQDDDDDGFGDPD